MSKITLLEIIPSLNKIGGGETFFVSLCEEISKKYQDTIDLHIVVLYKPKDTFLVNKINRLNNVTVDFLDKKKGVDFKCSNSLRKIIKKYKPHIVHCHLRSLLTLWMSMHFMKKPKVFFTVHNVFCDSFKNEWFDKMLIKSKYVKPIGVSNIISKGIEEKTKRESLTIYNGVDIHNFLIEKPINERTIDFVLVAYFSEIKNQIFAIQCFEKKFKNKKTVNLVLLGDGEKKTECEQYCKDHNLDNVLFKGSVPNVRDYLADSKILIVSSKTEANPMVINEAFASGLYVIATSVGGIPDIISDGVNGDLVGLNDYDSFAYKMKERITNIEFLENNRKRLISERNLYSIEKTAKEYVEIFKQIGKGDTEND